MRERSIAVGQIKAEEADAEAMQRAQFARQLRSGTAVGTTRPKCWCAPRPSNEQFTLPQSQGKHRVGGGDLGMGECHSLLLLLLFSQKATPQPAGRIGA